jgi:hypothetical protein
MERHETKQQGDHRKDDPLVARECLWRTRRASYTRVRYSVLDCRRAALGRIADLLRGDRRMHPPQRTCAQGASVDHRVRRIRPEQWADLCARAERGEALRALAVDYGVSHESIRRILHSNGLASSNRCTTRPAALS